MQLLTAAKAAGHFANADALRQLGADPVLAPCTAGPTLRVC